MFEATHATQESARDGANPRKPAITEPTVNDLNALSEEHFQQAYIDPKWMLIPRATPHQESRSKALQVSFRRADNMTAEGMITCFELVKRTSQQDYENSSIGWHPRRKVREMKDSDMRYLLVFENELEKTSHGQNQTLLGFLSLMITHDSSPVVPVLYIYEIHVEEIHRRHGIGRHLLEIAENLAHAMCLRKVMLTCFMSNQNAKHFYEKYGFSVDECSPTGRQTRRKVLPPDYLILSKTPSLSRAPKTRMQAD